MAADEYTKALDKAVSDLEERVRNRYLLSAEIAGLRETVRVLSNLVKMTPERLKQVAQLLAMVDYATPNLTDAIRSLLISHHLLGTNEWMIVEHTDCGMLTFTDADLVQRLEKRTGTAVHSPSHFHAFQDLESNVRRQIQKIRAHPWVPQEIRLRGFIYDVRTGKLNEVRA